MTFLYLLPAIGWGFMPIIAKLTNAKPINQLLGTTTIALLMGMFFTIIVQPSYKWHGFAAAFFSGCFWSFGQYLQFHSFQFLPVSEAMPISNGIQLIGTTFIAALFFGEWSSWSIAIIGIMGIFLIVVGIILTAYLEKEGVQQQSPAIKSRAVFCLLISSIALTFYVTLPQAFKTSGAEVLFPQAIGMWLSSILFSITKRNAIDGNQIRKNFGTGIAWSIANISLFFTMPIIGVAKSFTFSQLAVLISIYAGLFILRVRKTRKELKVISLGAALITLGIFLIGSVK